MTASSLPSLRPLSQALQLLGLTSLVLLGACSDSRDAASGSSATGTAVGSTENTTPRLPPAPAFSAEELNADPLTNWITNGGSLSNERFSPLTQLTRDNIGQVKGEWQTHLQSGLGPQHSGQSEPLVYEGVIYQATGENDVFAISVDSGEILWKYTAGLDPDGVTVCCGWAVRGVAIGEGRVYVGMLDARLIALDQQTGAVLWETRVADPKAGYAIAAAPRYYDGRVFVGVAGGEYQIRGRMQAFDADTGDEIWTFHTIPGPGEFGHDTWPDYNDAWKYGGAPVWQTPAIDPELGMIYFSTGNASPDQNGAIRPGDNLFTVSILALDVNTGEYRWHFQQTRHDIWDYDSSSPVVLFDVVKDGVPRKGLSQISKSGYLFLLDRITGEGLTPIIDTPVPQNAENFTAATQPIPQGDTMINHCIPEDEVPEGWTVTNNGCTYTPFGREAALYMPLAGSNWMPTAYDPRRGHLYVCASESIGGAYLGDFSEEQLGQQTGEMVYGGGFRLPSGTKRRSYQIAVDVRTHNIVWKFESDVNCNAGATVTAGDLLLISRQDGTLRAYDSNNGDEVWRFQLDAQVAHSPVVFEHKGQQKLLVFAAGSLFSPGPKSDSLWLLSLDGTMEQTELSSRGNTPPSIIVGDDTDNELLALPDSPVDLAEGEAIYTAICNACHGPDGQGGHAEGGAIPRDATVEHIFTTAMRGGDKMPSFNGVYSPEQLKNVANHIRNSVLQ
jgi:PQQ-dependent dehydrogenase (methanol/ethanol family)